MLDTHGIKASTPPPLAGASDALFERHLVLDPVILPEIASARQRYEALARAIRDLLARRWLETERCYLEENPKRVYYLSLEFLLGRSLTNNVTNLRADADVQAAMKTVGLDWQQLADLEPDAGLGNGGLGRLAACFMDSLATLQLPAMGYGLRYDYGIFRQSIRDGYQIETPDNWLLNGDPWEVARTEDRIAVPLPASLRLHDGIHTYVPGQPMTILGTPFDRPIVGYGGNTVTTLRLWGADSSDFFDLGEFDTGDFVGAILHRAVAQTVTRVLYPDDATEEGKELRFVQEFFLVACSLADIIARFRRANNDWHALPDKVAIHLNETHPALAVAELIRILVDTAHIGWDDAWTLTQRTLSYTNHTLLPEALERWPVALFETLLPRHLEIIYEINRRFLDSVRTRYPEEEERVQRVSLIEEGAVRQVRMAHLAVVGTHRTNGVSALHSQLLQSQVLPDLAALFPERFTSVTNGVTPRRWLLEANPYLAAVLTDVLGDGWITDLTKVHGLLPYASDPSLHMRFRDAKRTAKVRFAEWFGATADQTVDPDSLFDCQIKRIHAYKRQLLNVLRLIVLYNRLHDGAAASMPPRTVLFAGKAAPAYSLAKLIIKLINNVAAFVNADPATQGQLKVLFLPEYNVSLAERLIPASDLSEQISTAGYEASGTSNMKFMLNAALTIGTRDGATVEMAHEAGEENFFLFGLTAEQVAGSRGWYDPHWHYTHDPETKQALDMIAADYFSRDEPGIFRPILDLLLREGDFYMHLADLRAYLDTQSRVDAVYNTQDVWTRMAIANVASAGIFSSDRAINQYASGIWNMQPHPIA
jgi:starch phosphorylase